MENQVDGNISAKRSEELISIGNELKNKYMNEYLGKTLDVLFESYDNGYLYGYTPNYIKVKVKAEIVKEVQGDKVIAFKMKRRKGFRKKKGHRTQFTLVKVTAIA